MKKTCLISFLVIALILTSCNGTSAEKEVFAIRDKMFIAQINDIYLNFDDYKNKIIALEGIYDEDIDPSTNESHSYVLRYAPGCCGDDGIVGFEILYDSNISLPKIDDWIEVYGTLKSIKRDGFSYIALQASEINVLDVRGLEFVEE